MTDTAGQSYRLLQDADGLQRGLIDRNSHPHEMQYAEYGRLSRDSNAAGGFWDVARTSSPSGFTVSFGSALGRTSSYRVENLPSGDRRHTNVGPAGLTTTTTFGSNGMRTLTHPDGTVLTVTEGPDPRWGMQSPLAQAWTFRTPPASRPRPPAAAA